MARDVASLLQRLGLNPPAAARLLGVQPRVVQHWIKGERPIAEPTWRLLLLAAEVPAALARLRQLAAIT
jgi:DNA-binding transcriptional regulator YdaS (Cro superfamily)